MKYLSSILLFTFLSSFYSTWYYLNYQKHKVKKETKRQIIVGLDDNELILFTFSKSDVKTLLKWEHAKEFEFEKEMYDVVKTQVTGDTVHYWCWHDHAETALNRKLEKLVNEIINTNPLNKSRTQQFENFQKSLYANSLFCWHFLVITQDINIPGYFKLYKPVSLQPPAPPPKT